MCDTFTAYRAWWGDVRRRRQPTTARQYAYHVLRFIADVPTPPENVSVRAIANYLDGLSPQHAESVRSALADYFTYLHSHGHRADDPLAQVRVRRPGRRRMRRSLTRDELVRVLVACVFTSGERLAWAALACYSAGLRPGEFVALTRDRVHLNGKTSHIEIVDTKTDDDRIMPLASMGVAAYAALIEGRGPGRILGVGRTQFWQSFKRAALAAGVDAPRARPYALRHSFARHLIEAGVSERDVADLLGHADMRHMWGYTIPPDDERRRAVKRLED